MSELHSILIEASAGSGKTFQLSNRFIALLLMDQLAEEMIALTFTRKAAAEFTSRILNRLADGAESEAGAQRLAQELQATLYGDPTTAQPGLVSFGNMPEPNVERFRHLLAQLVKALDRLQLSTLDSFFTRLVRIFAPEMGIDGFELLDETMHLQELEQVMDEVLSGSSLTESQIHAFLMAFQNASYGKERVAIRELLLEFVLSHHEDFRRSGALSAWADPSWVFAPASPPQEFTSEQLLPQLVHFAESLKSLSSELAFSDKRQASWLDKWLACVPDYRPGSPLPDPLKSLLDKIMSHFENLAQLRRNQGCIKHYKDLPLTDAFAKTLAELLQLIIDQELLAMARRTAGIGAVLYAFDRLYDQQVRQHGRLSFSDLSQLLWQNAVLGQSGAFETLAYRIDARFRHWMLDEFQDTSRQQWEVIEPIIDEAVSDADGERSLFVVGDTKQAIYGWRGGEPRLFQEIRERSQLDWPRLQDWTMSRSYRSSQTVLDFVNQLCDPAIGPMQHFPPSIRKRWRYQTHLAAKPHLAGQVAVFELNSKECADPEFPYSPKWEAVLQHLQQLRPVERGLSCAILVTSNAKAQEAAAMLREFTKWPVETEASVSIAADSPIGLAILAWLQFLVFPGDSFSYKHALCSPFGKSIQQLANTRQSQWQASRDAIQNQGIAFHLEFLTQGIHDLHLSDFQSLRLGQILDVARSFDQRGGHLEDFIKSLQTTQFREQSAKGTIQIMTVHKAKGLEFDIVLLPDLKKEKLDSVRHLHLLKDQPDPRSVPQHFILKPHQAILSNFPVLHSAAQRWTEENIFERACNLYVAATRAIHGLYFFLDAPSKAEAAREDNDDAERVASFQAWVRDACNGGDGKDDFSISKVNCLYHRGDQSWLPMEIKPAFEPLAEPAKCRLLPAPPRQGSRTASSEKSKEKGIAPEFSPEGMAFGNEVHAIFESVERWEGQNLPDSTAGQMVRSLLDLPESLSWFYPSNQHEILREASIEGLDADGTWFSGVIDRAILERDADGTLQKIKILDFKTDAVSEAEILVERYRGQLQTYAQALSRAFDFPIERVEAYLLSTKLRQYLRVC